MNMTVNDLAEKSQICASLLNDLVDGESPVTQELASGLSAALGTSSKFWINLQSKYDR